MGESASAKGLLLYRSPVTIKDTKGVSQLLVALGEGAPLSGLVVQRLDSRGQAGREFLAANKRLHDLKESVVEAVQAVLAASNPPAP